MKYISQSSISRFYNPDVCEVAWYHEFVKGRETPSSGVQKRGLLFEYELIGGCRGGERPELPKSKAKGREGTMLKEERDIIALAERGKEIMNGLGITLIDVQPEYRWQDLEMHADARILYKGRDSLLDVKYTETDINDYKRGWASLGQVDGAKKNTQELMYVYMCEKIFGKYLPFYYLIFGKTGWIRFVKMEIKPMALEAWEGDLEIFRTTLKSWTPQPPNNYNKCCNCPHFEYCESKTTLPAEEIVTVSNVVMVD